MKLTLVIITLLIHSVIPATAVAENAGFTFIKERILAPLASDAYRVNLGIGSLRLRNPQGFDVSSGTYEDGFSDQWTTPALEFSGETAIGWSGRYKQLWYLNYDSDDFEGLRLHNTTAGIGLAVSPSRAFPLGFRLAAGIGGGISRSRSYFDKAYHPSIEAWLSAGLQLGTLVMDVTVRERASLGATLDERKAAPRIQSRMLMIGWLF